MRLRLVFCVAAMLALVMTAKPAAAGCGIFGHGCRGHFAYTYAVPAYTYAYPYYAPGYVRCGRVRLRNCHGFRIHTVPAYSYAYTYAYVRPCRRRRCW